VVALAKFLLVLISSLKIHPSEPIFFHDSPLESFSLTITLDVFSFVDPDLIGPFSRVRKPILDKVLVGLRNDLAKGSASSVGRGSSM